MKKKLIVRVIALAMAILLASAGIVTASAATILTEVDFRITAPSDGMTSETAPEVSVSDKENYSLEWTDWSTEEGYEPEGSFTFVQGETYYCLVKIKANSNYDFYYNTKAEVDFIGEGRVVETVSVENNAQTGYSSITYLISLTAREARFKGMINDVVIDVNAPMEGQTTAAAPKVSVPENKGYALDSAVWCGSDGSALTEPVRFVGGETYYIKIYLNADDGCWWNQLGTLQTTVNGAALQGYFNNYNSTEGCWADAIVAVTAEKAPDNVIPYVSIGFDPPASGTAVTFNHESYYIEANPEAETYLTVPEDADYAYSSYWSALWADSEGDSVNEDFTMYAGAPVYIEMLLKAKNGKHFDLRYTSVAIENAEILEASIDSGLLFIVFSFVPEKGENDVSLSFDANGGEGEMPTLYMPAGTSYTLPECSFTKADRRFTAWDVDGEKKNPKDVITVEADTVVKALWYNTKTVTVDSSNDTSTAEVIGTLILTDSGTGEDTTIEVCRGTCSSLYTNPTGGDASALVDDTAQKVKNLAAAYGIAADDDSIKTEIKVVSTIDKRRFNYTPDLIGEDGDFYSAFIIDGDYGHLWQIDIMLTAEKTDYPILLGDADGNGEIEVVDATFVQRFAANIPTPFSAVQLMRADVDGNGELDIVDATYIQRYLCQLNTPYPIGEVIS